MRTNQRYVMHQAKFSIEVNQAEFLNNYSSFGFRDKSSMVRAAIEQLKKEFTKRELIKSAQLYSEIYNTDEELKEITETAISEWPK